MPAERAGSVTALCRENASSIKQGGTAGKRLSLREDERFFMTWSYLEAIA